MDPKILLPSGLRPVKDVLHVLPALDDLIIQYPGMHLSILGPVLDKQVYSEVQKKSMDRPWLKYEGVVPFKAMQTKYEQADIVINTSLAEGQPAVIMEAMALGLPVIARKIHANEMLISHKETGWLYESMDEFKEAVHSVVGDLQLREQVTLRAREVMAQHFSPEKEAGAYIKLYSQLL